MQPLKNDEFDPALLIDEIKEKKVNSILNYRSSFVKGDYQQEELNSYLTEKLDNDMVTFAIILVDDPNPQMVFGVTRPEVTKSALNLANFEPSLNGPLMETLVYLFMQLNRIVVKQIKTVYKYITEHLLIQLRLAKIKKTTLHILYSKSTKNVYNARMELRLISLRIRASKTNEHSDWPKILEELRSKHGYEKLMALYDDYVCKEALHYRKNHRESKMFIKQQKRIQLIEDESDENLKKESEEALALEPKPMDDPESMNKPNLVEKLELLENLLLAKGFKLVKVLESSDKSVMLYESDTAEDYGSGRDSDSVKTVSLHGCKSAGTKSSVAHEAVKEPCLVEDLNLFEEYEALEKLEVKETESLQELYKTESESEEYDTMGGSSSTETDDTYSCELELEHKCKMMRTDSEELDSTDESLAMGSGSLKKCKAKKNKSLQELEAKGTNSLKQFEVAGEAKSMRNMSLEKPEARDKSETMKELEFEESKLLEELKSQSFLARACLNGDISEEPEPEPHLAYFPERALAKILLGQRLSRAELKEIAHGSLSAYFEKISKGTSSLTSDEAKCCKLLQFMASPLMQEDHSIEDKMYLLRESYSEMYLSENVSDDDQDPETEINSEGYLKSFVPVSEYAGSSTELLSISDFEDDNPTPSDIVVNTDP